MGLGLQWLRSTGRCTTTNRLVPVQIGSATNWVKVVCGQYHTLALNANGTLYVWGYNAYGQIGDGTATTRTVPTQPLAFTPGWLDIGAGANHTLGVKSDGTLMAWGYNGNGQLGDGTGNTRYQPNAVSNILPGTVACLSGGTQHSIAVLTNGTVMGWGYNAYGQLGDGTTTTRLTPVIMSGISTATKVACGDNHTLLLLSNGTMRACGYNGYGQLGDGSNTNRTTPVVCTGVTDGAYIASMYYTSGVLQSTNPDVVCMSGFNGYGQLGNSTYTDKNTFTCTDISPDPVALTISPIRLTNGYQHTQFVRSDGTLWGWGYNGYGQLGNGTTTTTNIAVQSGNASNWASVSAGYYHTVAIKTDGTLWAWGYNVYGQLGDGTTTNRTTPVQIGSATNWAKVECGIFHTAALTTTGELYIWGYNGYGQLGDGTTTNRLTPTLIFSFSKWKDISAGSYHTLGVKGDNSLWAWGYNPYGQLGDGTTTDKVSPVLVTGITGPYLSISAGFNHSAAVLSDGTVRTCGYNGYGQLGDGSTINRSTPVVMTGISTAVEVAAGDLHTMLRMSDGTLRACGYNGQGTLGDGTTTTRLTPVVMTGATAAVNICGFYRTSGYIGADPDVVCLTGDNGNGQIGDGTYVNKNNLTCTDLMPNIATNVIVGSPFCAGATVNVPFTVTYGPFNAGNVFTAQLSSSTGSFSSPVDIGTLSATTSGTIAATIPSNTPYGTAYRIRVVASDPAVEGTPISANLMVLAAPVITSVVGSNTPGASVVINGTGFGTSGSVTLGGVALSTSLWSNTSISATLPIGTCGGNLEIVNNCGFASAAFNYPLTTIPAIVSVTPVNGTPGSSVTIAGTNFTASGTVTVGGSPMVVTAWNNTSVTATLPAGLCSGAIVVSNSCGSSSNSFSYTLSLIPTIVSVTPSGSTPGSSVTILGTNFTGSGTVTIGSLAMPVTAWTATSITATLPSGICSGAIVVTNSCGSSSSGYNYTLNVTPAITSVSPLNGTPGSSVTIDGINFSTSGTVTIGGLAMSVSTWTVTSITATLPFGICSGAIVITNSCGSSSSGFIYNLGIVPVITSVTPVNSLPGTSIVINGTGFSSAGNTVTIAGISATITAQSVSSITVNVPAGACNGSIVVANSCGTASAPFAHNASIASSVSLIGAPLTSYAGTSVNFTATPIYGGSSPMYQWKVNGNNQGIPTTDNTFSSNSLNDGDAVSVSMTSSALCATPATSGSNTVAVTITPQLTWYLDADNDGYYVGSPVTQCSSPGAGYNTTATTVGDCNDGNPAYTTACPPVNDDCSGAIALTVNTSCIPATYATLNATNSGAPNPTCGFYQGTDVWFRILVPASGNVRVEVNGISGYNAQFAIYTGGCGNLTQYTCNQLDPAVTISDATLAGQTLYVRVYRYNSSASGSFNICAYEPVVPSNNNCVNATAVTVGATCVMSSYTNAFATAQPASIAPNPTCGFYNGGDVWFTLQMPASGRLRMEFINGTCNAQYALYSGTCGAFTQLVCSQLDPDKTYINTALSGQTLYLRVWNYNNEDGGTFQMCLWEPPLVPNDDCASALPLSVGTACTPANYSSQYATSQAVSVAPNPTCGFYAGGDVWFTLQMPLSGVLTINVTNIVGNAQFALYSGTCGSMTQVACAQLTNTMNISNLSLAGQTLYLRVFGFSSEEGGVFTLCSYDPSCLVTISSVNSSSSSCSNVANGSITISATCANCTGALEYSINSGSSYQPSPVFTGLLSGVYGVRVRDAANVTCLANYGAAFVNATATAVAYYQDIDNDGYGNSSVTQYSCTGAPVGYVAVAGDCNDGNNAIHPGATEICGNGIDEDCSGVDLACAGINTWLGTTTDWHTAGNWSNNVVPNSCASDVLIPNLTNDPIVTSPVSVGNINLQSGTVLTLQATLTACGNWSGGSAGFSEAVGQNVILNGSSAQQISGETRFDKLNLTNPFGAALQPGTVVEVYDVLELQQGNLNTTGGTFAC
ncbi:MAG: hypothetical protein IPH78_07435 [Bacteroidetes bacterium]|nr:hypothetical protein [Bacteroidota bacterium]